MRLLDLTLSTHPTGHRIDLRWLNPDPVGFPGIRVVRREGTFPKRPDDGVVVVNGIGLGSGLDDLGREIHVHSDVGLNGDTTYYYRFFPFTGAPPPFDGDPENHAIGYASSALGNGERMYARLPAIYRRYDAQTNLLRRFVELTGTELDVLESHLRSSRELRDIVDVDGRILPRLAEWIGWKTDFRLEFDGQRNEIRDAPALFQRVGLIPVANATVTRISGWQCRAKEYVHNVHRTNEPPRLQVWGRRLAANFTELDPETLVTSDWSHDGRASSTVDDHGVRWVVYHTRHADGSRVWYKTSPTFTLPVETAAALAAANVATLQVAFSAAGAPLTAAATVTATGSLWHVDDPGPRYVVEPESDRLLVYRIDGPPLDAPQTASNPSPSFAPSRPLTEGDDTTEKEPVTVLQGDTLWVIWSTFDRNTGKWELRNRTRRDGQWSEPRRRFWEGPADPIPERRQPAAVVDQTNGLWLFWLERSGDRWSVRYNRHDGTNLAVDPSTGWQFAPPLDFPLDGPADPRVHDNLSALFHAGDPNRPIWVFWARQNALAADPAQTRWTVAYRIKRSLAPGVLDWDPILELPKPVPDVHDREPAARVDATGNVLLFWSSTFDASWSIWRATLDLAPAPPVWGPRITVTGGPYGERRPTAISLGGETLLLYGGDRHLAYFSRVYGTAETLDFRYTGSTTAATRNAPAIALRGLFTDFATYTHDGATGLDDVYRRDTVGLFVTPTTLVQAEIDAGLDRLRAVIPEFLPAPDRAVFTPE